VYIFSDPFAELDIRADRVLDRAIDPLQADATQGHKEEDPNIYAMYTDESIQPMRPLHWPSGFENDPFGGPDVCMVKPLAILSRFDRAPVASQPFDFDQWYREQGELRPWPECESTSSVQRL
jgi:hypothetical protein